MATIYTPPQGDELLFELLEYTPPQGDSLQFLLGSEAVSGSFYFKWRLYKEISNSFYFKWRLQKDSNFFNLVSYPIFFISPSLYVFSFKTAVSGIFDSVNISFGNTGDSGTTTINVYKEGILNETIEVEADNSAYNKVILLDKSVINTGESIRIEITSAASNSNSLFISVNQKTFCPELKIINIFNLIGTNKYRLGNDLFYNATKWSVLLNQPLKSIEFVRAYNIHKYVNLSYALETENYYNDKVSISPADIRNYNKIIIKGIDLNGIEKIVTYDINFYINYSDIPNYLKEDISFITYVKAKYYSYSWNNENWSQISEPTDGKITISPTNSVAGGSSVEGERTLYLKYYIYDKRYNKYISESKSIYYYYSDVNCDISLSDGVITYEDNIPIDKIEIYIDDELIDSIYIDYTISGFTVGDFDDETNKITIGSGTLVYEGGIFSIAEQELDIDVTGLTDGDKSVIYKIVYLSKSGALSILDVDSLEITDSLFADLEEDNNIPLYLLTFGITIIPFGTPTANLKFISQESLFSGYSIPIYTANQLEYKIYDKVGRYKTIDMSAGINTKQEINCKLVMKNPDTDVEIKNGQIHFLESIKYSVEDL